MCLPSSVIVTLIQRLPLVRFPKWKNKNETRIGDKKTGDAKKSHTKKKPIKYYKANVWISDNLFKMSRAEKRIQWQNECILTKKKTKKQAIKCHQSKLHVHQR